MSKTCSICLENVHRPANLDLICECKYYVHYTCFNNWWKDKKNCIICHEICNKPNYYKRNRTPIRRKRRKKNLIERIQFRRLGRRIYPPDTRYIHEYLRRLPFDNENEIKTITVIFMAGCIIYILFQLL